jgi:hypothetical protein
MSSGVRVLCHQVADRRKYKFLSSKGNEMTADQTKLLVARLNERLKIDSSKVKPVEIEEIMNAVQERQWWDSFRRAGLSDSEIFEVMFNSPPTDFDARKMADDVNEFLGRK